MLFYFFDDQVVRRVADCNAARVGLAADMADDSQRIKVRTSSHDEYAIITALILNARYSFLEQRKHRFTRVCGTGLWYNHIILLRLFTGAGHSCGGRAADE